MILAIHVGVALASIAWATFTFFRPSQQRFNISYGLIASTLASGTILILVSKVSVLHVCMSGLIYTSFALAITLFTKKKVSSLPGGE